ncbi:M23 family metallopeptidase [Polaribacter aestuariivivens]|uniref:M23 family metallopeptidase n=1 Tax=Polaribacter aestuariivivens TaxID=2304626 RepID=UPI003F4933A9
MFFASCSNAQEKPSYISFETSKDSLYVIANNSILSTSFLKIENRESKTDTIIDFKGPKVSRVLQFDKYSTDSTDVIENYKFSLYYGASSIKKYDTLYNYALPFSKRKRYKVLQGQNTNFTHRGALSKYAIDFKMNIGQTVCAMREGVVIKVKKDFNKGGRSKKYRDFANLIIIFHEDGTFAQYVHLKKNGALVKKGDFVKRGQPIGYSGNTGMSTEPHLHFAVYKPSKNGLVSIPYILDSISSEKYKKGKYAINK